MKARMYTVSARLGSTDLKMRFSELFHMYSIRESRKLIIARAMLFFNSLVSQLNFFCAKALYSLHLTAKYLMHQYVPIHPL